VELRFFVNRLELAEEVLDIPIVSSLLSSTKLLVRLVSPSLQELLLVERGWWSWILLIILLSFL